jgi:hypothetical protein
MDAIQVTARMAIHEGRLEEFKELAALTSPRLE